MIKIYEVYYEFFHGHETESFWLNEENAEKRIKEILEKEPHSKDYLKISTWKLEDSSECIIIQKSEFPNIYEVLIEPENYE